MVIVINYFFDTEVVYPTLQRITQRRNKLFHFIIATKANFDVNREDLDKHKQL